MEENSKKDEDNKKSTENRRKSESILDHYCEFSKNKVHLYSYRMYCTRKIRPPPHQDRVNIRRKQCHKKNLHIRYSQKLFAVAWYFPLEKHTWKKKIQINKIHFNLLLLIVNHAGKIVMLQYIVYIRWNVTYIDEFVSQSQGTAELQRRLSLVQTAEQPLVRTMNSWLQRFYTSYIMYFF